MTSRARTAKTTEATPTPAPAKKTTGKRAAAPVTRPTRRRTPRKTATAARTPLSLVKPRKELPTRARDFMTDAQGYATLAGLLVGITTVNIRDWRDHRDNTCTRTLRDGSTLHYDLTTRTLTWQAVCRMGAVHQYELTSRSIACAARLHADACEQLHADLTKIPRLTADELAELGLLNTPTWARNDLLGDQITETIPVPLPDRAPRALADTLTSSTSATDETHPMSLGDIADGLAARTAADTAKEHPQT